MLEKHLNQLIASLADRPHGCETYNPYQDVKKLNNLKIYLTYILSKPVQLWLVGEAPGYRGCRETGIPFTSSHLLETSTHPFFVQNRSRLFIGKTVKESTASCLWSVLAQIANLPLLWNAFPFHPHQGPDQASNRSLNSAERAEGLQYLRMMNEIFSPKTIVAVGRMAGTSIERALPGLPFVRLRHPSYGGSVEFKSGLEGILHNIGG